MTLLFLALLCATSFVLGGLIGASLIQRIVLASLEAAQEARADPHLFVPSFAARLRLMGLKSSANGLEEAAKEQVTT